MSTSFVSFDDRCDYWIDLEHIYPAHVLPLHRLHKAHYQTLPERINRAKAVIRIMLARARRRPGTIDAKLFDDDGFVGGDGGGVMVLEPIHAVLGPTWRWQRTTSVS